jgi:hypothetical protein
MGKVTLSVPIDLVRRAKAKAALLGTSLSAVVREFLAAWVKESPMPSFDEDSDG